MVIDIETVPQYPLFSALPPNLQVLWEKKTQFQRAEQTPEEFYQRAGIMAEFGKIICISMGVFDVQKHNLSLRIKSFYGHNEKAILSDFIALMNKQRKNFLLCAHNGKEFDFPYLCRRMIINELQIPEQLQLAGKKPWEIKHLDTMDLWKFGDYKNYTSLDLLATILNIPTPKDDIDGSMVAQVYYHEQNLERIVNYCQKDVATTAQILLRLNGKSLINDDNIFLLNA